MNLTSLCDFPFSSASLIVFSYRGDDGKLRLGVRRAVQRRAVQLRNEALFEAVNNNDSKLRTLSAISSSLENRSIFHVCFDPRFVDQCK